MQIVQWLYRDIKIKLLAFSTVSGGEAWHKIVTNAPQIFFYNHIRQFIYDQLDVSITAFVLFSGDSLIMQHYLADFRDATASLQSASKTAVHFDNRNILLQRERTHIRAYMYACMNCVCMCVSVFVCVWAFEHERYMPRVFCTSPSQCVCGENLYFLCKRHTSTVSNMWDSFLNVYVWVRVCVCLYVCCVFEIRQYSVACC